MSRTEERYRWERMEEPPEGWVWLHNQLDDNEPIMHELWADSEEYRADRKTIWIKSRRITQTRFGSDWEDAKS